MEATLSSITLIIIRTMVQAQSLIMPTTMSTLEVEILLIVLATTQLLIPTETPYKMELEITFKTQMATSSTEMEISSLIEAQ